MRVKLGASSVHEQIILSYAVRVPRFYKTYLSHEGMTPRLRYHIYSTYARNEYTGLKILKWVMRKNQCSKNVMMRKPQKNQQRVQSETRYEQKCWLFKVEEVVKNFGILFFLSSTKETLLRNFIASDVFVCARTSNFFQPTLYFQLYKHAIYFL